MIYRRGALIGMSEIEDSDFSEFGKMWERCARITRLTFVMAADAVIKHWNRFSTGMASCSNLVASVTCLTHAFL